MELRSGMETLSQALMVQANKEVVTLINEIIRMVASRVREFLGLYLLVVYRSKV